MLGRRVFSFEELTAPGAYYLTTVESLGGGSEETMWFVVPNEEGCGERDGPCYEGLARVAFPPHTYRECGDGSLEVRASIQVYGRPDHPAWHGYLDEGHSWREE